MPDIKQSMPIKDVLRQTPSTHAAGALLTLEKEGLENEDKEKKIRRRR
jgi:hypothetical protein